MCTSAPDGGTAHAAGVRHYFADYEAYDGGLPIAWGQVTHSCAGDGGFEPAGLVETLRTRAARQHGLDSAAIRLRCVCRL